MKQSQQPQGLDEDANMTSASDLPILLLPLRGCKREEALGISVPRFRASMHSDMIRQILEGDPSQTEVELPGLTQSQLTVFVEWVDAFPDKIPALPCMPLIDIDIEKAFGNKESIVFWKPYLLREKRKQLYEAIVGANYLGAKAMLHYGCAVVASLIKGRKVGLLKNILNPDGVDVPEEASAVATVPKS